MEKTLEINFCFCWVCKVVVEVQQNFILLIYAGVPQVKFYFLLFYFLLSNFINQFHKFIVFFSRHFFFNVLLFFFFVLQRDKKVAC
jgi:hypothetical protein